MKSRLLIILVFAGVLGLVALVGVYRASQVEPPSAPVSAAAKPVRYQTLERRSHAVTESFYGLIEADTRVDLAFQIPGRIQQLGPVPGQKLEPDHRVQQGDVVARLAPERYEAQLAAARSQKAEAQAALAAAAAEITEARARLADAQQDQQRISSLLAANSATPRELDKANLAVDLAQAALERALAREASAQAAFRSAEAAEQVAQVNLEDATLIAPLDASVAQVDVELGTMIQPGQRVLSLVDLDRVNLVVGVVERKLPLLKVGQPVAVEVLALSHDAARAPGVADASSRREGRVSVVPPAADPVTGLFNVEIELANDDLALRPGMVGRADVEVLRVDAIAVPMAAARRQGDRATAYFADVVSTPEGDRTIARRVTFRPLAVAEDVYLVDAMPGDFARVIVEGQQGLADGQTINLIDAPVARAGEAEPTPSQPGVQP